MYIFYLIIISFVYLYSKSQLIYEYIFVTAIYAGNSKHSNREYKKWIKSFSSLINNNLFIFCNKDGYFMLTEKLKKYVKVINEVFELERINEYKLIYKKMWKIDPEKKYHNYRLYGIWNGKISMLKYVSERIESKIYIWIDIGSNRENKTYSKFPSMLKIKYLQSITKNNGMFFFLMNNFPLLNYSAIIPLYKNYIQGGTFGGSKESIINYYNIYYSLHDYFLHNNYFVGKEQILYNSIAKFKLSNVVLLKYKSDSCNNEKWFRFYDFYANLKCAETSVVK